MSPFFEDIAKEIVTAKQLAFISFEKSGAFKETYRIQGGSNLLALKVLDPQKCDILRTQREISSILKCDSPYIGKLYDHGDFISTNGGSYKYFIEEFFDGGTLSDKLALGIDVNNFKLYGTSLCHALNHLKTKNLVHRDIKPDNIMFSLNHNEPKLVDFGLVRDLTQVSATQSWFPQGPGTPLYSAPEQLNNDKKLIKWRTDQFALGLVLGICLTGKHPFEENGMNIGQIVDKMANRESCTTNYELEVKKLGFEGLLRMIKPWPVQRYTSIQEIIEIFK